MQSVLAAWQRQSGILHLLAQLGKHALIPKGHGEGGAHVAQSADLLGGAGVEGDDLLESSISTVPRRRLDQTCPSFKTIQRGARQNGQSVSGLSPSHGREQSGQRGVIPHVSHPPGDVLRDKWDFGSGGQLQGTFRISGHARFNGVPVHLRKVVIVGIRGVLEQALDK